MIGKRKPKLKTLTIWISSYVLIFMVPFLFMLLTLQFSRDVIFREIYTSNTAMAGYLSSRTDKFVLENMRIVNQLLTDNILLKKLLDSTQGKMTYDDISISNTLRRTFGISECIKKVAVFLEDSDMVFYSGGICSIVSFHDAFIKDTGMPYGTFITQIAQGNKSGFLEIGTSSPSQDMVAYIAPCYDPATNKTMGNIVVFNDKRRFLAPDKNDVSWQDMQLSIFDDDCSVISTMVEEQRNDLGVASSIEQAQHIKIDDKEYFAATVFSSIAKWKYTYMVNGEVLYNSLNQYMLMVLIIILLCAIIGATVIYFAVRFNYSPVAKLYIYINESFGNSPDSDADIYSNIRKRFAQVLNENKDLQSVTNRQEKTLSKYYVSKLLKDRVYDANYDEVRKHVLQTTQDMPYCVVGINIIEYEEIFYEKVYDDMAENLKSAQIIISNIISEFLEEHLNSSYYYEDDDLFIGIFSFCHTVYPVQLTQILEKARALIKEKFNSFYTLAFSGFYENIKDVSLAYKEMMNVVEYMQIYPEQDIVFYERINKSVDAGTYYYPTTKEQALIHCVKAGDFGQARNIIEEIFGKNFADGKMSIPMAKCIMFNLISTMVKVTGEMENSFGEAFVHFVESLRPLDRLFACTNINQLQAELYYVFEQFSNILNKENTDNTVVIANRVKQYIKEYYMDANISVASISEMLGYSRDYISRIFKNQIGIGLLEYIHMTRIEAACDLFKNGKYSVAQVSEMTGYTTPLTFSRAFTKQMGITPGKYGST